MLFNFGLIRLFLGDPGAEFCSGDYYLTPSSGDLNSISGDLLLLG